MNIGNATQVITVKVGGSYATVTAWQKGSSGWKAQFSTSAGRVGSHGVVDGATRRQSTYTTLSSQQPTVNHDGLVSGKAQTWLSVGNNSGTYGKTRAVLKFPTTSIPTTATVLENKLYMWGAETTSTTSGAVYELHSLTRDFTETQATWNNATSTTPWTTAGGDFSATVSDTVAQITDEVGRHWWDATGLMQSWVRTPANNKGVLVKLKDETTTGPQERTLFLSAEASDPQLRPYMQVIYVDSTTEDTYYAPTTPSRMTPNSQYTVEFTVTNTTATAWAAGERQLSYTWKLPDGTDVTTGGNQLSTTIPALLPGKSVTVQAQVKTPINSDSGSKRTEYVLGWDIRKASDGSWLSAGTGAIPSLKQNVAVEDPTSNTLGLEKFYSYTGQSTGAGSSLSSNLAYGNTVWQYNAFSNPGRGLSTFFRMAYNSLDTSDTVSGHGWSMQASGPVRLGAPLEFHPKPNPTEIRLPDGDGTTHVFRWDAANSTWKAPAGVHYKLTAKAGLDCTPLKDPVPDAWTLTRPDGTRFLFGCDGYLTSTVDKNGNTMLFTYEERKSNNKPTKFLKYVTDPAGRKTLTVDYWTKGQSGYQYVNDAGVLTTDSGNLNNSKIYDHIKSVTDVSGRRIEFHYTTKGLLGRITDGAGSTQPKAFAFTYDATQGNKNVKLVRVDDPRGNGTRLSYYAPQAGDDPKYHWWTKTVTDRRNGATGFTYAADTANPTFTATRVTDQLNRTTAFTADDFGRPVQTVNAKSQTTKMNWDADNNVTYLEEANGAKTAYCYDQKTGYPLWMRDAENNKAGVPSQSECAPGTFPANSARYTYQTRLDGYSADLFTKSSPEGRTWNFTYDSFGNLKTVTDPKGVSTATAGDYTTSYTYDSYGQLTKATDANGNPTTNSDFGPTGYPATITDALNNPTTYVYDELGQVTQVTDALGKKSTQTYDVFGRPLVHTVPKDQAAGELITAPAPEYDANDNVIRTTAPNGAVSSAVYDEADQITSASAPKDTSTSSDHTSTYTYDGVGNLKTVTEPKGTLTTTDATDYTTTNTFDEIYQLTSVTNAAGDKISYEYDNVGNTVAVVDPRKNTTADATDYTTKTTFDLNHRLTEVKDAAGKVTKRSYDKDSLVLSTTDAENNTRTVTYDERGKPKETKTPHTGTSPVLYRTTQYEYDQVGNTTKVITPRGLATGAADDFTQRTEYDALNRAVKRFQPYDPADGRYNNPNVYTQTVFDTVGRVAKVSLPPSAGQSFRNDTTYSYFDNGWTKSSTDPWDIVTTYEYNELGKQTKRTLTSAGGSSDRTMAWTYYPDGKLKSKSDDGVPVGKSVVLVDNSDTQNTASAGTWATGNLPGQQGYDHRTHATGAGTDSFTWTLNVPKDGTYTAYVKYPKVTGAATSATYTLAQGATTHPAVVKNQTTGDGTWVSLGSYSLKQGGDATLKLAQSSTGIVVADGVKLVRDTSGETDTEKRTFTYGYDANANLTSIDDTSSGAAIDAYSVVYTGLNQVQKVTEALSGQDKNVTSYTYDVNGRPDTVTHPRQFSKYTYDLRELVKTVAVGTSASDASPKLSSYTYTDRGQKLKETKANGNTVDYTYYLDGVLKTTAEKKSSGTLVSSHTYAYDANGNKAQDVARKMNAANHAAYLDSTTDYTYDPADRIAAVTKTGNGSGTETYVHDDNANVISQNVRGVPSTFTYDRNRLQSSVTSGSEFRYTYDPFGRQESVTNGGRIIERNVYDGFDHVVESQKMDDAGAMRSTTFTFDPLDRTASKTAAGKTTDYDYLGISGEVLGEEVAGRLTKSYQYSPWGERLSQITHNTDGTSEDAFYGYNSHTDVETLTDKNGDTKATYGYTAYGDADQSEFTGIDKPDTANPDAEGYNPYRFNGKRWDPSSGTYDMGFRSYDPGLNRFTTRDMYSGALSDMSLGADPFTGNRYAFTGGNPTSRVEVDGHHDRCETGIGPGCMADLDRNISSGTSQTGRGSLLGGLLGLALDGLIAQLQSLSGEDPSGSGTTTDNRGGDCRKGGKGWVDMKPTDSSAGGRSTGVTACLDSAYLKANKGSPAVQKRSTGYRWAQDQASSWGYTPATYWVNACHLLAKELTGTGRDARNLSTCARPANAYTTGDTRMEYNFRYYERLVRENVDANRVVQYSVTPNYFDGDVTIPQSWTFEATVWYEDGSSSTLINNQEVWNQYTNWDDNLGGQVDDDGYTTPRAGTP
ncbi:DNRLRE domain-containing protein [Streptomyces sp. TLI_105]|uniref:DNRLRE domain-containing protein n=1 Tax=Streptomyces sp. TLI_105 TaxID=1881019 RepID=UPI00352533E6